LAGPFVPAARAQTRRFQRRRGHNVSELTLVFQVGTDAANSTLVSQRRGVLTGARTGGLGVIFGRCHLVHHAAHWPAKAVGSS
jgi:hypothetical protein